MYSPFMRAHSAWMGGGEGGACAIIYVQLFGEPSCETVWPAMCRLKSIWAECVPSEIEKKEKVVFLLYFILGGTWITQLKDQSKNSL
jgi:hypothetical protein